MSSHHSLTKVGHTAVWTDSEDFLFSVEGHLTSSGGRVIRVASVLGLETQLAGLDVDALVVHSSGCGEQEAVLAREGLRLRLPVVMSVNGLADEARKKWLSQGVVACLPSERWALGRLIALLQSIPLRPHHKVLVVDDSSTARAFQTRVLRRMRVQVIEATQALDGLRLGFEESPSLALIDFDMPEGNGVDLTTELRRSFGMDQMAIIGLSATTDSALSIRFLRAGANDFLPKPFSEEELECRVSQNLDFLDRVSQLRDMIYRDHLTGLRNRRFFFERGPDAIPSTPSPSSLVALDLDHFKKVNDTYGHDAGDLVLRHAAAVFEKHFPEPSIVARIGGEEMAILVPAASLAESHLKVNAMLADLASKPVLTPESKRISVTVSAGLVQISAGGAIEAALKEADALLYKAKMAGRNRCVTS